MYGRELGFAHTKIPPKFPHPAEWGGVPFWPFSSACIQQLSVGNFACLSDDFRYRQTLRPPAALKQAAIQLRTCLHPFAEALRAAAGNHFLKGSGLLPVPAEAIPLAFEALALVLFAEAAF